MEVSAKTCAFGTVGGKDWRSARKPLLPSSLARKTEMSIIIVSRLWTKAKKSVSPVMHACVHMLSYVVINLILAIIVIYVNFLCLFLCKCLALNYRMFNLNVIHLHVILMVFFKANFLLMTINVTLMVCSKANFLLRTMMYYFTFTIASRQIHARIYGYRCSCGCWFTLTERRQPKSVAGD